MLDLGMLLNPAALSAAAGAVGLAVVEEQVSKAITDITKELDSIRKNGFQSDGFISAGSFGRGKEAGDLAREHKRAHQVVVYSLTETIGDLELFLEAIREAKRLIGQSDEDAEARLTTVLARTESLSLGTTTSTEPIPAPEGSDS